MELTRCLIPGLGYPAGNEVNDYSYSSPSLTSGPSALEAQPEVAQISGITHTKEPVENACQKEYKWKLFETTLTSLGASKEEITLLKKDYWSLSPEQRVSWCIQRAYAQEAKQLALTFPEEKPFSHLLLSLASTSVSVCFFCLKIAREFAEKLLDLARHIARTQGDVAVNLCQRVLNGYEYYASQNKELTRSDLSKFITDTLLALDAKRFSILAALWEQFLNKRIELSSNQGWKFLLKELNMLKTLSPVEGQAPPTLEEREEAITRITRRLKEMEKEEETDLLFSVYLFRFLVLKICSFDKARALSLLKECFSTSFLLADCSLALIEECFKAVDPHHPQEWESKFDRLETLVLDPFQPRSKGIEHCNQLSHLCLCGEQVATINPQKAKAFLLRAKDLLEKSPIKPDPSGKVDLKTIYTSLLSITSSIIEEKWKEAVVDFLELKPLEVKSNKVHILITKEAISRLLFYLIQKAPPSVIIQFNTQFRALIESFFPKGPDKIPFLVALAERFIPK